METADPTVHCTFVHFYRLLMIYELCTYVLYRLNTRSAWWTQNPCNAGHGHIPDIMKVQSAFRLAVIARIVGLFLERDPYVFTTILTVEQRINACFDPPTCGLFLTCTKGIYLIISDTHVTSYDKQTYNRLFKQENPLLGMAALHARL